MHQMSKTLAGALRLTFLAVIEMTFATIIIKKAGITLFTSAKGKTASIFVVEQISSISFRLILSIRKTLTPSVGHRDH